MNVEQVYNLEKELPVFIIYEDGSVKKISKEKITDDDTQIDDEIISNRIPDWVIRNHWIGKTGERIAQKYLKKLFKKVSLPSNDKDGYDLQADELFFEVKTSTAQNSTFIITANELNKANKYRTLYNIFYIAINETKKTAVGYIIQNPLSEFRISYLELFKTIKNDEISFTANGYKVKMSKYLKATEKIELTNIYRKLTKK